MNKFYLLTFALVFTFSLTQGQEGSEDTTQSAGMEEWKKNVEISTGHVEFRDDTHFAYTAQVYNTTVDEAERMWRDLMKNHSKKVKVKKNEVVAEEALFPRLFDEPVDVHATFNELYTTAGVELNVAFVRNGQALLPPDMSDAREEAKREVYDLAIELNRTVVADELDGQEDDLKDLERDLEKLKKENESHSQVLVRNAERIETAHSDIATMEGEIAQLNEEITNAKAAASSPPDSKEQKAIDKLSKELEKAQSKVEKEKSKIASWEAEIEEAKNAIPANQAAQDKLTESIAKQMEHVEGTRYKLRTVQ